MLKPPQTTFNRQIKTMQALYGKQLSIPAFSYQQLHVLVEPLLSYYSLRDRELIADRVCETIRIRQKNM